MFSNQRKISTIREVQVIVDEEFLWIYTLSIEIGNLKLSKINSDKIQNFFKICAIFPNFLKNGFLAQEILIVLKFVSFSNNGNRFNI